MTIGIKDVAREAKVSVATVSRVLSNGPVSAALRKRVEAAIRATGYRPNLSARRLRSQDSQTIGLIVSDIRNTFFTAVSRAVEDAAYQANLRVVLCNTDENPEKEMMYLRLMQGERISGLIFAPTRAIMGQLETLSLDFPVVLIDRAGPPGLFDSVVLDNRQASAALIEHLYRQGYRRIAGLFGNTSSTAIERHDGYQAAMAAIGLTPSARFTAPNAEAAEMEMSRWLAETDRPEAFVASNGLMVLGIAKAARKAGLRIPQDLAISGFDNDVWTELIGPGLSVIEQPVHEIGRAAMALLFERMAEPEKPTRKVMLSGKLIVRGSTQKKADPPATA
jgi:LacI family fructose operon transcriptional repressor